MERDTHTTSNSNLIVSLRQKVKDREGEIEELYREIEEKKRKIAERQSQLQGEGLKINKQGGNLEDEGTTGIIENFIPNINPSSSDINKGDVEVLRQEVVCT